MGSPGPSPKVRSELRMGNHSQTDARQAFLNAQVGNEWLDLEKHAAWHGGYRLNQVICRKNEDGWQLIVKAHRNGRAYVAYLQTGSLPEAFEFGGEFASRGLLTWQHDDWPSKWLKRTLGIE